MIPQFGKGVYFADMSSKSGNYCATKRADPVGLLLLSEVALGDVYERKEAEFVRHLPDGKLSCKGIGRTRPDPAGAVHTASGATVPTFCGSPRRDKSSVA